MEIFTNCALRNLPSIKFGSWIFYFSNMKNNYIIIFMFLNFIDKLSGGKRVINLTVQPGLLINLRGPSLCEQNRDGASTRFLNSVFWWVLRKCLGEKAGLWFADVSSVISWHILWGTAHDLSKINAVILWNDGWAYLNRQCPCLGCHI